MSEKQKLYWASTNVPELGGYRNVDVSWFCVRRENSTYDYQDLIDDYEKLDEQSQFCAKRIVEKFLTAEEVEELRQYLKEHYNNDVTECSLPVESLINDYSWILLGGYIIQILLYKDDFYPLSIPIVGLFNAHDYEFDPTSVESHENEDSECFHPFENDDILF